MLNTTDTVDSMGGKEENGNSHMTLNGQSETEEENAYSEAEQNEQDSGTEEYSSEEQDASDEDEEEEEEEEDNEEPALKYERIGGEVSGLLTRDSASALAVSSKFLVCSQSFPLSKSHRIYRRWELMQESFTSSILVAEESSRINLTKLPFLTYA